MPDPIMRIGNCFEGGKSAQGYIRMVRYGARKLDEYTYNVFDPEIETGVGESITVDEIKRFFDRAGKGEQVPTTTTDPRATTGANMFAVLDEDGKSGPEYHVRQTYEGYPHEMEKGRSWGKNDDTTDSVGLSFQLYSDDGAGEAWFDNGRFEYSNLLWEFSPDGGNKWYQWYNLPNKTYTRMTLPRQTNTLKARVLSNNPQEWLQAFAIIPHPDFQIGTPDSLVWNTDNGESDFSVSIVGYATWTEATGGSGVFVYYIYEDGRMIAKTRLTSYQLKNYDPDKTYTVSAIDSSGTCLDPYIEGLKINRLGSNDYVGCTNEFYATFTIGDINYDTRNGNPMGATWSISNTTAFDMTVGQTCSIDYMATGSGTLTVKVNQQQATLNISSSLATVTFIDAGYFYYSDAGGSADGAEMYSTDKTFGASVFSESAYILLNPHFSLSTGDVKKLDDPYMSAYLQNPTWSLTDFEVIGGAKSTLVHWKGTSTTNNNTGVIKASDTVSDNVKFTGIAQYADVYYVGPSGLRISDQLNVIALQSRTVSIDAYVIYECESSYDSSVAPSTFIKSVVVHGYFPGSNVAQSDIETSIGRNIQIMFPTTVDLSHGEIVITYSSEVGGSTTKIINYMYSYY